MTAAADSTGTAADPETGLISTGSSGTTAPAGLEAVAGPLKTSTAVGSVATTAVDTTAGVTVGPGRLS